MEASIFYLFALLCSAYGQYMSTWGSSHGYSNQMQMGGAGIPFGHTPYTHTPYHHIGVRRDSIETIPYIPRTDSMPIQMLKAKIPARIGIQDYPLMNVNVPDQDDMTDHIIYRQSLSDMKRPIVGVLSLLSTPTSMGSIPSMASMGNMATGGLKSGSGYMDSTTADELMTCVGMEMNEPMKIHSDEPRLIISRGMPYYFQSMQKIKQ